MSSKRKFKKGSTSRGPQPVSTGLLSTAFDSLMNDTPVALEGIAGDPSDPTENADGVVEKVNVMVTNVKVSSHDLLLVDAELVGTSVEQVLDSSEDLEMGESDLNLLKWAEAFKLKARPKGDERPITALANAAKPFIRKTLLTGWSPLNGSFELASDEISTIKKKQLAEKKQKDVAEKKEPEETVEVNNVDETMEAVQEVYKKLKQHFKANESQPLNYFRFVIDPTSFTKSTINMFHISFLSKDRHVEIFSSNGHLWIYPVSSKRKGNGTHDTVQDIVSLSWPQWENHIKELGIKSAMI